jgi:glycosyltransferase involved in cell wall biosynthesis
MIQPRLKIALVGDMLSRGGAEKVQARLSFYFETQGIEVHHIIVRDEVTYDFAGVLFNMGKLKNESNGFLNKYNRLRALRKYLHDTNFDFIIDFRVKNKFLQEYIIANWIYKSPFIMSIRSFDTNYYFPKSDFLASNIYKKAFGFITVSKAIESEIRTRFNYQNVKTIYNPIVSEDIKILADAAPVPDHKYFLGIGRMENSVKQFDHMIASFKASEARSHGFKLLIIGEGVFKEQLEKQTRDLDIENDVLFIGQTSNPFPYYKNAYATLLTSKNEGFPNVLIESLATGTPVIAYDCKSGPAEIIEQRTNGLLVENQSQEHFIVALNEMISDKELYNTCKLNASKSVKNLEIGKIGAQWLEFMNLK